jgi:hypothetical protein
MYIVDPLVLVMLMCFLSGFFAGWAVPTPPTMIDTLRDGWED